VTSVPFQEWHLEDGVLFELTDNKRLLDRLISDASRQLNYTIEGNARPVSQSAILPLVRFHLAPDPSAEGIKKLATYEVRGTARIKQESNSFTLYFAE